MRIEELYSIFQQYPSVQTDTRQLKTGDIFFALKGPNFNGNHFVANAFEMGAVYAIIDEATALLDDRTILVEDVLETLQDLARYHRQQLSIPFLAITGSNGKTTTKELIHAVLSTTFRTYTTSGNLNNHIGVPLTLLKIKNDAEMAVIEMGANHQQEIASYCKVALPTHGLITNCGKAHLEGFGGEEGVRKGKGELFDFLRGNNGAAFIMKDYDYLQDMSRQIKEIFTYGTIEGDIVGTATASDPFLITHFTKGFSGTIATQLVGSYNLPNVLAAVAVGKYFNIEDTLIRTALETYTPTNSRSQLVRRGSNIIILDAYNANPSSMKLAIENFAKTQADNKVLVLGAMAELGAESLEEHRQLVEEIKKHQWKEVLLVGGDFMKITHPFHALHNAEEAGKWLQNHAFASTHFLLKGSRSTGMEKVLDFI